MESLILITSGEKLNSEFIYSFLSCKVPQRYEEASLSTKEALAKRMCK